MIWVDIIFITMLIIFISMLVVAFISMYNDLADISNSHLSVGDKIVFKVKKNAYADDVYTGIICKTYREDITVKVKDKYFTINHSQILEKLNKKKRFL